MEEMTQERLKELLHYDPDTGIFTWKQRGLKHFRSNGAWKAINTRWAGKEAGTISDSGYRKISIFGKVYRAHRLAFLYIEGMFPKYQTDHINHDKLDNRWANLRDVDQKDNGRNKTMFKNNTSGITGVNWDKQCEKWRAQIMVSSKNKHLGIFDSIELAKEARLEGEIKYGYHDNHGMRAIA